MTPTIAHYRQVFQEAELLCSEAQVLSTLDRLAIEITEEFSEQNPLLLCVMTGGVVMMGHLITRLDFPLQLDYIHVTRYRGAVKGGVLDWIVQPSMAVGNRSVLIVDDIFDEGVTLKALSEYCHAQGATMVKSAVLVNKQHTRKVEYLPDYIGLDVVDRYVFGFGMDYEGYLRNAAGIYAVKGL